MYCEYCGSLIEEGALFCTSCGNPVSNASQISGEENRTKVTFPIYDTTTMPIDGNKTKVNTPKQLTENKKKDKRLKKTKSPSKNRFRKRIIAIVVAIVLLIGAVGAYFIWRSDEGEKAYFKPFTYADIEFPESGDAYIRNELVLTGNQDATYDDIEDLAEDAAGEIVGYISISNDYQIQFDGGKGKDELDSIIEEWSDSSLVASVGYHYVFETDGSMFDYSNDEWWNYKDGDKPDDFEEDWSIYNPWGNNWGVESIWMPKVWESDLDFNPVKIGIIDTMFEVSHPDFTKAGSADSAKTKSGEKFVKAENNPDESIYSNENYKLLNHGTHVAGIIGAYIDNGVGIAGVAQNAKLYGYSMTSTEEQAYTSIMQWKIAIATELIEGVKAINISLEIYLNKEDDNSSETIEDMNSELESFLNICLDKGYDFLIVKSFDSIDNPSPGFITAIKAGKVRDHIIVVGGANCTQNFTGNSGKAHGSMYNTKDISEELELLQNNIDIYAPGTGVDSDVLGGLTECQSGTSVAAPFITGEAALLWGLKSELTSLEVKSLILENYIFESMYVIKDEEGNSEWFYKPYANAYYAIQAELGNKDTGRTSPALPRKGENECIMTVDDGDWKQAYIDILSGFEETDFHAANGQVIYLNNSLDIRCMVSKTENNPMMHIDFGYINDDDIPELIICDGEYVYILSYRNGKIIEYVIESFLGKKCFGYSNRKGIITGYDDSRVNLSKENDVEYNHTFYYRYYIDISGEKQKLIEEGGVEMWSEIGDEINNNGIDYCAWRTITEDNQNMTDLKDSDSVNKYKVSKNEFDNKEIECQKKYGIEYFYFQDIRYTLDEAIEYIKSL